MKPLLQFDEPSRTCICEKIIKCRKTGADYYKMMKISTRLHIYSAYLAIQQD